MNQIKNFNNREILNILSRYSAASEIDDIQEAIIYILGKLNVQEHDVDIKWINEVKAAIRTLKSRRKQKWNSVKRIKHKFESKYASWLDSTFCVPDLTLQQYDAQSCTVASKKGRPGLLFDEMSSRSQRRVVAEISAQQQHDPNRILMACRHAARLSGDTDLFAVIKHIQESSSTVIKKQLEEPKVSIKKLTADQALAYLLDQGLSKDNYVSMRLLVQGQGADIFPAYNHVRAAKELCRPPKNFISITESNAEICLQALLNHTAKRIIDLQSDVIQHYYQKNQITEIEAVLICSWGFDGSTGHSSYKQQYQSTSKDVNDEELLATTLIPLRLTTGSNEILWNNRASQSTRFCRPIRLQYVKESGRVIQMEKECIDNEIDHLKLFEVVLNDNIKIRIHFCLYLTLIDGKVFNYLTNTKSMQTCPICRATPKQFNNLENKNTRVFLPDPKSLHYGVSPLHAWIRFLECCLHISYRLDVQAWQMRSAEHKEYFVKRKHEIQKVLWDKLGLKVDKVKAGGSGTSNDGNTARRAFENPEILSECLGLDLEMIQNFRFILIALSCQLPINPDRFDNICWSTAKIYVSKYNWYPMPASIHKILIHGVDIIRNSLLPVGMLGEEASEGRNKDYKLFRLFHSRKCSRLATIEDVFNRIMDTSDPIISTLNLNLRIHKKQHKAIPKEVIHLLDIPKFDQSQSMDFLSESNETEKEDDSSGLTNFYESLHDTELTNEEQYDEGDL